MTTSCKKYLIVNAHLHFLEGGTTETSHGSFEPSLFLSLELFVSRFPLFRTGQLATVFPPIRSATGGDSLRPLLLASVDACVFRRRRIKNSRRRVADCVLCRAESHSSNTKIVFSSSLFLYRAELRKSATQKHLSHRKGKSQYISFFLSLFFFFFFFFVLASPFCG